MAFGIQSNERTGFVPLPIGNNSEMLGVPMVFGDSISSSDVKTEVIRLARRRANKAMKDKNYKRSNSATKSQGRPLSKETRVKLTLVSGLGVLYSILVSDTLKRPLRIIQYSKGKDAVVNTNSELCTKNLISGFSSLLKVQSVVFRDDRSIMPEQNLENNEFPTIDDAVGTLFGIDDYSLVRVTRAAATERGGSVLLKIETAIPGHLYLNDDEDEAFETVEMNREYYQELVGSIGDRPTTTFLKKRVARPRYKSDMRIYLIPKSLACVIYCEPRMFKRDLLRGFLNMKQIDRSVIISFDYESLLKELREEGHDKLINEMGLPSVQEVNEMSEAVAELQNQSSQTTRSMWPPSGLEYTHHQVTSPTSSTVSFMQPTQNTLEHSQLYGDGYCDNQISPSEIRSYQQPAAQISAAFNQMYAYQVPAASHMMVSQDTQHFQYPPPIFTEQDRRMSEMVYNQMAQHPQLQQFQQQQQPPVYQMPFYQAEQQPNGLWSMPNNQ